MTDTATQDLAGAAHAPEALGKPPADLEEILAAVPGMLVVLEGAEHRHRYIQHGGDPAYVGREALGRPMAKVFPELVGQGLFEPLDGTFRTGRPGGPLRLELRLATGPDRTSIHRWFEFHMRAWRHTDGDIAGVVLHGRDITAEMRARSQIEISEERLRWAAEAARVGTFGIDYRTGDVFWSPVMRRIVGIGQDDPAGRPGEVPGFIHPDDRERFGALIKDIHTAGGVRRFDIQLRVLRQDGSEGWIDMQGNISVDEATGQLKRGQGVILDITARKQAELHRELLLNELNHRVKNSLATVKAIANRTLNSVENLEDFEDRFVGRLNALARAHDVAFGSGDAEADLGRLVEHQLMPYAGANGERIGLSGDAVSLPPDRAHDLGLILHEMATNAAKYGALSAPQGRLDVTWRVEPTDQGMRILVDWRESGGPPVAQPKRVGFGTQLIRATLAHSLHGSCDMTYHRDGLHALLTIRLPKPTA
ncbi:sensor histidine kinase [Maricaulis sp. CAU 1757]